MNSSDGVTSLGSSFVCVVVIDCLCLPLYVCRHLYYIQRRCVRVTLRQGYDNLNVLPNGFVNTISRVAPHGDVIIEIEFEDENPNVFFPILIDPSTREVTELKCASGGGPSRIARFTRTDKGWIKVRHTGEIRFLVVSPEGECELWNIALVPQKENLFLIFQRMFREPTTVKSDHRSFTS